MTTTNYDEAQVRAIALEDNRRAARQCRHLATDLRRARTAWRAVSRLVPQDEAGQDRPHALECNGDLEDIFEDGRDRLTYLIGELEDRAACFDAAAERVSRAIDRAYSAQEQS